MHRNTTMLACVVLGATLSTAHAQPEPDAPRAPASDAGSYSLTLPEGRLLLDAFAEINLSSGGFFKPFSLTPDLWYGAADGLTVGLVHSTLGATGFIGGVGDALCLTGTSGGCAGVYENVGVDVRYRLSPGAFAWAFDGGLFINNFSPFELAVKLGIAGRWQSDKLVVEFAPNVFVGITHRTIDDGAGGSITVNGDVLDIPVTALYSLNPKLAVSAQLGLILPFENLGDSYAIPLSLGVHYQLDESTTLTGAFSLPLLIAGSGGGVDARSLTLGGTYAF